VALVTGAGRGIGRAVALAFARRGAQVAANDITPINLDETVAHARKAGGRITPYVFDIAKRMPVREMVDQVIEDLGRIDILVNNAAVSPQATILNMDEWDWQRTLDVNLSGPFYTIQYVGRLMVEQGRGVVVNVATGSLEEASAGRAAYLASKAGLISLTRQAARELGAYNIRVNAVCPALAYDRQPIQPEDDLLSKGAAARQGLPDEVAEVILFLCSPAAAHIAGQAIAVDGGLSLAYLP
jgi:NAD(P)-dependent dehydrogenase (short-subunit alcohol dehydrogenase family)